MINTKNPKVWVARLAVLLERYRAKKQDKDWAAPANDAYFLYHVSLRMAKLAEHACNRELTARELKEKARIKQDITNTLLAYDPQIRVRFEGDPRGYVVVVRFPGGESNCWTAGDYGIA